MNGFGPNLYQISCLLARLSIFVFMDVSSKQIKGKPKTVGKSDGKDVQEVHTKGGLAMIIRANGSGGFETLGTGPHRAVARAIANKKAPGIKWTELNKSDYVPPDCYEHLLPKYEALTDRMRQLQGY